MMGLGGVEESPYWLIRFSEDGAWKMGLSQGRVDEVLETASEESLSDVWAELNANGLNADKGQLANLVRWWVVFTKSLSDVADHTNDLKRARAAAERMLPQLKGIEDILQSDGGVLAYPLSLHLDHPIRVHETYAQLDALRESVTTLRPAFEGLASQKLPRGPRTDEQALGQVEALMEIFEFVTGRPATRSYDAADGMEAGPFHAFVERVFRMVDGPTHRSVDWYVRKALEQRRDVERPPSDDKPA